MEPAWGNYNETWGNSRYDFREYTVWDGVIGLPVIEAARAMRADEELADDPNLSAKADMYIGLVERMILRHHGAWTQLPDDQGYYWDDPLEDVGPIVNRFTALGRVELVLSDVTGNTSYLDKPRQMARYMIENMRYHEAGDLYTWEYWFGQGGSEDISHGAIELEFLIMANERGLLDDVHLLRLSNTYLKRIWQVPELLDGKHILAMRVDGTDPPEYDYARISRGWVLLSAYNPLIYDHQRTTFGILNEKSGLYASSVTLLGLAQIPLSAEKLRSVGLDPDEIRAVDTELLDSMLSRALERLDQTVARGAQALTARSNLDEASTYVNEESLGNASVPIALIWKTWETLGRMMETGDRLQGLLDEFGEAESLGLDVSRFSGNLTSLRADYSAAETGATLDGVDMRISGVSGELGKPVAERLIEMAREVIGQAEEMGIDTSRHQIFLDKAVVEFEKGNYAPAKLWAEYPLRLREEVPDGLLSWVAASLAVAVAAVWSRGRKYYHFY
jgi:hypothetical protein